MVDEEKVLAIMDEDDFSASQITGFVQSANIFVTQTLTGKVNEDTLEQIEIWLSAHLVTISKARVSKSEEAGGAKIVYAGDFGKGLNSTQYGQTAIALDYSRTLHDLLDAKKAMFKAIKTE